MTYYHPYISLVCRLILGGVFLFAGASKIVDPGSLAASIRSYALPLPEWFVTFCAYLLPYLEVMLGLYLMAGLFTRACAWVANVLMVVFIGALLQGAARGLDIDCGCFGSKVGTTSGSGVWDSLWVAFARDLVLLGLGMWIARAGSGSFSVDARLQPGISGRCRDDNTIEHTE
jgi:putative oxidoreductase